MMPRTSYATLYYDMKEQRDDWQARAEAAEAESATRQSLLDAAMIAEHRLADEIAMLSEAVTENEKTIAGLRARLSELGVE